MGLRNGKNSIWKVYEKLEGQVILLNGYINIQKRNMAGKIIYLDIGIPIGKFTYGYRSYHEREMHSIGSFCSIGIDQHLVQNGHNINYVSTYGNFLDYKKDMPNADRSIRIGNDVWIGAHSIIRSGVTIGDGSVIGAGSVITKDVEPYTVVVGSNRVIKQRFSDSIVESLLSMKWWEWDDDKIFESMKYWSKIEEFIARYK